MARDERNIVSYSVDELAAMERRGESRTDWQRAAQAPIPGGSDPDDMIEEVDPAHVTTELPPLRRRPAA